MASKNLRNLNELDFDNVIAGSTVPVLVDFGAEWCAPCKAQAKILERLVEGAHHFVVATVDIDESPGLAVRFGVRGVPTLLAFDAGKEVARRTGLASEAAIRALVSAPKSADASRNPAAAAP